jgi:hypothetical protein
MGLNIYSEYLCLAGEVIGEVICDYLNYRKAQIRLWRYYHQSNFSAPGKKTLGALSVVLEHEQIQGNKKAMISRIKNSKKTA